MSIQPLTSSEFLNRAEPFVDADTAAAFVGISRRTLLQKARAGKLPGHPLDPHAKKKDWRFKLSELDQFLRATVHSPTRLICSRRPSSELSWAESWAGENR